MFAAAGGDITRYECRDRHDNCQDSAGEAGAQPSWVEWSGSRARFAIEPTMRSRIAAAGLEQVIGSIMI